MHTSGAYRYSTVYRQDCMYRRSPYSVFRTTNFIKSAVIVRSRTAAAAASLCIGVTRALITSVFDQRRQQANNKCMKEKDDESERDERAHGIDFYFRVRRRLRSRAWLSLSGPVNAVITVCRVLVVARSTLPD